MTRLVFRGDSSKAWLCLDLCLALSPSAESFPSSVMAPQSQRMGDARACSDFIRPCHLLHGLNIFPSNISSLSTCVILKPSLSPRPWWGFTTYSFIKLRAASISFASAGSLTTLFGAFFAYSLTYDIPYLTASL
ncbi:hypothetical protein LX36DRAFT_481448 [Colletotrichum falcatum]|nr:hypothetical protein LX36DRAFT_481448 [Colletotrichum falcatum]